MRFIPATFHGFLDYAVALTLIAGPLVLGFSGIAMLLSIAGGAGLFVYSLITDYSTSIQKMLPFKVHLLLDFVAALVLVAAPFLFGAAGGFDTIATYFYVVIGAAVIVVVGVTNPQISTAQTETAAAAG